MSIRAGIIGLGTVGSRFVEQFALHPSFELVAAWDLDPLAGGDLGPLRVDSAEAVVEAAEVVYVAVPPAHHRTYVEACLAAGRAVFCEKPLGVDVEDSRRLVESVEGASVPVGMNFVFSGATAATALTERISDGSIGDLVRADLRLHFPSWPRPWHEKARWLRYADQGGWLREVASHFLFLTDRVVGPAAVRSATVRRPAPELCEDLALVEIDAGGTPLTITGSSGGGGPEIVELTVRGTTGALRLADWYRLEQATDGGGWVDQLGSDRAALAADAYRSQLDQLAAMVRGDSHRLATVAEGLAVQEVVEALLAP